MNRSAAWSSSAVVTPGLHLERSMRRQRAWISPAAAIASICSAVLRMIIERYISPQTLASTRLSNLLFHPQGGKHRVDALTNFLRGPGAVDVAEDLLGVVACDHRLGLLAVLLD